MINAINDRNSCIITILVPKQTRYRMYKLICTLLLVCVCRFSADARPYLSATPVDNGSFEFPKDMSGAWKEQKNQFALTYNISYNPNKLGHINIAIQMGPMMPAILSKVNEHIYMSMYDAGGKQQPEGYYIYRVVLVNEEEVKLIPLKRDLTLPAGKSLYAFLADTKEPEQLEEDYAIWLSNSYKASKKPLNTEGRAINITKKRPSPTK